MTFLRPVLLGLPGLALGIVGLFHPRHLNYATSQAWWTLHVPGLLVFPLVGVALMFLVRGRRDPVALAVVVASFVYATAYSALDVINGIAAGYVTHRLGPGVPRPDEVRYLFAVGGPFGTVGSIALVVAVLVVLADSLWRVRLAALPAVVLLPGAYLVHAHHIFSPEGVLGMWLVALGTGWLGYVLDRGTGRTATTASRSSGP